MHNWILNLANEYTKKLIKLAITHQTEYSMRYLFFLISMLFFEIHSFVEKKQFDDIKEFIPYSIGILNYGLLKGLDIHVMK